MMGPFVYSFIFKLKIFIYDYQNFKLIEKVNVIFVNQSKSKLTKLKPAKAN